jgi:hypothetical protein
MSSQQALKHMYLSIFAGAGLWVAISVAGNILISRYNATIEDMLKPIADAPEKLNAETATTKAEVKVSG